MYNVALLNEAYRNITTQLLEKNLIELNKLVLEKRDCESFWYHGTIYTLETNEGNFSELIFSQLPNEQFRRTILPKLLNSLGTAPEYFNSEEKIDDFFPDNMNGFYGIDFTGCGIDPLRQLSSYELYQDFKYSISLLDDKVVWEKKSLIWSSLKFCSSVDDQTNHVLALVHLSSVFKSLTDLEKFCIKYKGEKFDLTKFQDEVAVVMSPESQSTLQQFSAERTFTLPTGKNAIFSWHIKISGTRIYLHPEGVDVFIGYIGPHLPTKKYKK